MDTIIFSFAAIILVLLLLVTWHQRRLGIWEKIGLAVGIIVGASSLFALVLGLSLGLPLLIRITIGVASCVILTAVILSHYNLLNSPSHGEDRRRGSHVQQPRHTEESGRALEIVGLNRVTINRISLTSFGRNPQVFVGNVWTISIHNELSASVSDCNVELLIFMDGRDLGYTLPLRWRGHRNLPMTCNVAQVSRPGMSIEIIYHFHMLAHFMIRV